MTMPKTRGEPSKVYYVHGGKADLAITKLPRPARKIVLCQRQAADAVITMFRHKLQQKKGEEGSCNSFGFGVNRKQLQREAHAF